MEKILELAKKLKALADRGIGGEKLNAQAMLESLMNKHGITMDMIEENDRKEHTFHLEDKDKKFWMQIVASVMGIKYALFTYPYDRRRRVKLKRYIITCTPAEAIEIQAKYDFFSAAYANELEIFYSAFIQKNKLYAKDSSKDDCEELTPEELEKLYKMLEMMKAMSTHHFLKQLKL